MRKIYIGIDPDLKKSGFAAVEGKTFLEVSTLTMPQLITKIVSYLDAQLLDNEFTVEVVIEAGWLNQTKNYHGAKNKSIAARIGANVGENHATGKILEDFMKHYAIPYRLVKPNTSKWTAEQLKLYTGYDKRTNQEERDAIKLVYGLNN